MNAIEVKGLVRKYGDFKAVKGINFEVKEGEVFGFLGPNGAGKTTTISMLCTLLHPTEGQALVNGHDIEREAGAVRQSIGLIFQESSLDERLTGRENLNFHAMLYDVAPADYKRRSEEMLAMVDLSEKADDLVRNYSGGMKRRLEIARGLLHYPKVLFLDEPTIGLDPQTRVKIWEYLLRLRQQEGITMFMTTHYLDEAEHCDRIAIIDHGEIVALDTPDALKAMVGGDVVSIRTSDNDLASQKLEKAFDVQPRPGPDGHLIVEIAQGEQFIPSMMLTLSNSGSPVEVQSVNLRRPTLEDVFIKLTGRAIREEEASAKDQLRNRVRMYRGGRRH